jgi:hypothetical protein
MSDGLLQIGERGLFGHLLVRTAVHRPSMLAARQERMERWPRRPMPSSNLIGARWDRSLATAEVAWRSWRRCSSERLR